MLQTRHCKRLNVDCELPWIVVAGLDVVSGRSVDPKRRWRVVPAFRCYVVVWLHTPHPVRPYKAAFYRAPCSSVPLHPGHAFLDSSVSGQGSAASLIFSLGTGWCLFDFERGKKRKNKTTRGLMFKQIIQCEAVPGPEWRTGSEEREK